MTNDVLLREVLEADLSTFFSDHRDPEANAMAAFTTKDPANRHAFMVHWHRIMTDPHVLIRTIVVDEQVAGSVSSYTDADHLEVTYWLGKRYWGQGIATQALTAFLAHVNTSRPMYARAAKDNLGSLRVLAKCGFTITGADTGFANARGTEVEEYLLMLA